MAKVSTKRALEFYKKLYLLRAAEEGIQRYYFDDEMKTPMHMSMGGEAIAVGVISALKKRDQVFGTYRSHAIYLAKTEETNKFFAELYGKATGEAKGKAGSMHLASPSRGFLGTSAVVATTIPVAVGAAFANKRKKNKKVVTVFFGDGAVDEGVFWESLNLAGLWKLPVIFIYEDNGLAIHTPTSKRQSYKSIEKIVSQFNFKVFKSDTTNVLDIYKIGEEAVKTARKNKPCFVHLRYYRYLEHVGVSQDFKAGYRSEKEFKKWYKKDPILLMKKELLKRGMNTSVIEKVEKSINRKIENSITLAQKAPFAPVRETFTDIFV